MLLFSHNIELAEGLESHIGISCVYDGPDHFKCASLQSLTCNVSSITEYSEASAHSRFANSQYLRDLLLALSLVEELAG